MIADWSVEAGPESPSIDVPWEGRVDLHWRRRSTMDLDSDGEYLLFQRAEQLPEVRTHPELRAVLRMANGMKALTSKADVFSLTRDEVDPELGELFPPDRTAFGLGSYLDCYHDASRHFDHAVAPYEEVARATSDRLHRLSALAGGAEIVIRPARLYDEDAFGWTLYAFGFGATPQQARAVWSLALLRTVWSFQLAFASASHGGEESARKRASSSSG